MPSTFKDNALLICGATLLAGAASVAYEFATNAPLTLKAAAIAYERGIATGFTVALVAAACFELGDAAYKRLIQSRSRHSNPEL